MVSGAFVAVFGADCGKRRPTQVDWVTPSGLYTAGRLCGRRKRKKSTAKLLHRQYMSLDTSNIVFWCFSGRFWRVLRWKCARHRCAAVTAAAHRSTLKMRPLKHQKPMFDVSKDIMLPVQQLCLGFFAFLSSTEAVYWPEGAAQSTWVDRLLPQSAPKMAAKAPETIYIRVSTLMPSLPGVGKMRNCGMRKVKCGTDRAECIWLVSAINHVTTPIPHYTTSPIPTAANKLRNVKCGIEC